MKPQTQATLEQLEGVTWFSRVGVHDTETAIVLSSWPEAIEHCANVDWEDLCLEAANRYREQLLKTAPERFILWNDIVDIVKPSTMSLVALKIDTVVREYHLPKVFEDTVQWDILHLCMEAEYADVCPPGFYASQGFWYAKGHFPCGWEGAFPKGRMIVY